MPTQLIDHVSRRTMPVSERMRTRRILVVDDEEANVKLLQRILKVAGYANVVATSDPRAVGHLYADLSPDLILLDLRMPHVDGFAVLAQLQELIPGDTYLPILMLTGDASSETRQQALRLGARDFLLKPFDASEVVLRVENLLETRVLHLSLEDKVRERTTQLEAALSVAESASLAKSEFLANMSHELRTPLNSVIGFANILLKNKGQNLDAKDIEYIDRIQANGLHLLGLINSILDLSKIEAGQVDLEITSVGVGAVVQETIAELEPQADARGVQLIADVPDRMALIDSDRAKLKQVIINLVGNAVKFTERGTVTVRVTADPQTDVPTRIDIIDTGTGIPADRLGAIFEAFRQADSTTSRHFGGTGLGLTITRSLAQLMGFEIQVESRVGVGSTFSVLMKTVSVPALAHDGDAPNRFEGSMVAVTDGDADRAFLVLIIDDESDARLILRKYLEDLGCAVMTAASADEGIALARTLRPDLITLDIMMPRKNGWDALRELKADVLLQDIAVVVVSVVANENRGRMFGAVDCLDKPVTRDALAQVVQRNFDDTQRRRVLLVQDDPSALSVYSELAHTEQVDLQVVTGIDAARRVLESLRPPDLIVLDVGDDATQVSPWVSAIRDHPHALRVPVVVVVSDALVKAYGVSLGFGATVLPRGEDLATELHGIIGGFRARRGRNPPSLVPVPA